MPKRKKLKTKIIIPIIVVFLIIGAIEMYIYIYNKNSLSPREISVDLSYEEWDKTYPFPDSEILDENGFIRITSRDFYKQPTATLNFDRTKKITLNFLKEFDMPNLQNRSQAQGAVNFQSPDVLAHALGQVIQKFNIGQEPQIPGIPPRENIGDPALQGGTGGLYPTPVGPVQQPMQKGG